MFVTMERKRLHVSAQTAAQFWEDITFEVSNRNPLTFVINQLHLKTIISARAAVTPQVRAFQLVDADGVVSLWALDWKGFQTAISGVNELNMPLKCEVDQAFSTVAPQHRVDGTSWKVAWQQHRGAKWSNECVRLTWIRLTKILKALLFFLNVLLILTGWEKYKF